MSYYKVMSYGVLVVGMTRMFLSYGLLGMTHLFISYVVCSMYTLTVYMCVQSMLYTHLLFTAFKGIVSRDFEGLQMILMDRIGVPDVPLEVYYFLNFRFHIVF